MSETPETDALREAIDNGAAVEAEMTSLAGKLERELDEAREALGLTIREIERMREGTDAAILQLATVMKLPRPLTIDETIAEAAK